MTATLVDEPTPEPDPMAEAMTALTTLARGRRTVGAGTPNEHFEPADFAEVACLVLTAVAANVGGVDELLAGRSGSWEADRVRQIVQGTAGSDSVDLKRYRTEPLYVTLDVEADVFSDFGIEALYSADVAELDAREAAADEALFAAFSTPQERARIEEIRAAIPNLSQELTPEESTRADALMGRPRPSSPGSPPGQRPRTTRSPRRPTRPTRPPTPPRPCASCTSATRTPTARRSPPRCVRPSPIEG